MTNHGDTESFPLNDVFSEFVNDLNTLLYLDGNTSKEMFEDLHKLNDENLEKVFKLASDDLENFGTMEFSDLYARWTGTPMMETLNTFLTKFEIEDLLIQNEDTPLFEYLITLPRYRRKMVFSPDWDVEYWKERFGE